VPAVKKRDALNGRNPLEEMAHRFKLSNADCKADPRIGRLLAYKVLLERKIASANAANVRPLAIAVGYSDQELERLDWRVLSVLKTIRDSQRHLAILCPKKKPQPTKEKVNG
jgi:hypothetical protein